MQNMQNMQIMQNMQTKQNTQNMQNLQKMQNMQNARPSILCVTHQMMNYKWYLMVLGQYMTILAGTWSAKGLYACIYWKKWRFGRVTPMPDTLTDRHQNIVLLSLSPV